jgi:hypothetical protein
VRSNRLDASDDTPPRDRRTGADRVVDLDSDTRLILAMRTIVGPPSSVTGQPRVFSGALWISPRSRRPTIEWLRLYRK